MPRQGNDVRAIEPVETGFIERNGARVAYEVFGEPGGPTLLLMPSYAIVHSRMWKMQVPYLARHFRVISWDGVGNGPSDRPVDRTRYAAEEHAADALAVLDATGADRVIVVSCSKGTHRSLRLIDEHPDRVEALLAEAPLTPLGTPPAPPTLEAMATGDQEHFLRVFFEHAFPEPHSSKAIEDSVGWGAETTLTVLADAALGDVPDPEEFRALAARIQCPVLVVQGTDDGVTPPDHGRGLVEAIGDNASLVEVQGSGHGTHSRDSVWFSLLVRDFVGRIHPPVLPKRRTWTRAMSRPRRALFLSAAVGLGHTRRDVAIARELRALQPDLQIDWLSEDPVTRFLTAAGERVHPASAWRTSESAHFESEAHGHDLHAFQALRRMDEIQARNFMVLHDVLEQEQYDLVVADEQAEVDYFLHENPELKSTAYAWLTDFVGWLPMSDGGAHEAWLTADYNAEMIEHIDRFPRVRDRSIYIGSPEDLVPEALGPGLPTIREWTEQHFAFPGYVSGTKAYDEDERAELRRRFGYRDDQLTCIVTAGGTAVGATMLNRVLEAFPYAAKQLPDLRMVVVAGPRIDPASLRVPAGAVEVLGFLPQLDQHLAACDLAVVQGGLTTTMELTANRRPFVYFPLANHFEQQRHVAYRLDRYGAGRRMQLGEVGPEDIADALVAELARPIDYRPVETDGARRAAELLAELL
jgi:pimeloyl-ACP methyl ester carboxylesterase/predicted glycosyltransferase